MNAWINRRAARLLAAEPELYTPALAREQAYADWEEWGRDEISQ